MNGFGFIEYEDALDARDVVPGMLFVSTLAMSAVILMLSNCQLSVRIGTSVSRIPPLV